MSLYPSLGNRGRLYGKCIFREVEEVMSLLQGFVSYMKL